MRKMIVLLATFISLASLAQAQTAKPTKEQTIEFLKGQLLYASGTKIHYFDADKKTSAKDYYTITAITFDGCKLTFQMKDLFVGNYRQSEYEYTYSLSLSDIEKVDADYDTESMLTPMDKEDGGSYSFEGSYIVLYTTNKKDLVKGAYVKKDGKESNSYETNSIQIWCSSKDKDQTLKAFNHLRKLCGAPDPISFD